MKRAGNRGTWSVRTAAGHDHRGRILGVAEEHPAAAEIVSKGKDGKIVVSFEVHNQMDFREQIARWMPYFQVLSPPLYREFVSSMASQTAVRNE